MSESISYIKTEYALVVDTLNMHRTTSNKTTLNSEISNLNNERNVAIAIKKTQLLLQEKSQFQFQVMNFVKNQHFLIFFLGVNLGIILLKILQ